MKLRSVFFLVSLLAGFAECGCTTTQKNAELHSTINHEEAELPTETYAALAKIRLEKSLQNLNQNLNAMPSDMTIAPAAEKAVSEFYDMLTIFVYVIPAKDPKDPYILIRDSLETARSIFRTSPQAQLKANLEPWRAGFLAPVFQAMMHDTFGSLNQTRAAQRRRQDLCADHWASVNFIPDVKAPAAANLHDYAKALFVAVATDYEDTNGVVDVLSPEGKELLEQVVRKTEVLNALITYFPKEFEGAKVCDSIALLKSLQRRTEVLLTRVTQYQANGLDAKAKVVRGRAIAEDWKQIQMDHKKASDEQEAH